jgi:GTP-dependent phosphoenolpyruvate carboxykinase
MNKIADLSHTRTNSQFYEVVMHFCSEENIAWQKQSKREWDKISRESRMSDEEIWSQHSRRYEKLFIHMKKVCLARYRHMTRIGLILSRCKDDEK